MKSYFNFNRKEMIGATLLALTILVFTVILNVGYSTHLPEPYKVDYASLGFLSVEEKEEKDEADVQQSVNLGENKRRGYTLVEFDPNDYTVQNWQGIGFSEKQAESIVNYHSSYGPFKRKEDIRKLYVVSDEKYAEIAPFINIKGENTTIVRDVETEAPVIEKIEINSATIDALVSLKGIGETYANRIVKYRAKIGGFVHVDQIDELYISDSARLVLKKECVIDPAAIKKVNINTASKDELRQIPYSNWAVVAAILKEREVADLENLDFLGTNRISAEDKERFFCYIDFR